MEDQGEYKFDKTEFTGATSQLTEVEKAQASVKEWQSKIDHHKKELHFAEKNLKVHQWALKKLQEIEK